MSSYKDHFKALLAKYNATLTDAEEQHHLTVSAENVAAAKAYAKKHPGANGLLSCPLVQGALDPVNNADKAKPKAIEVMVGNKVANIIFENPKRGKGQPTYVAVRYTLPKSTQDMITIFDKTKVFEPGEYLFDKPSPGRRLGYKPEVKADGKKRTYTRTAKFSRPAVHTVPRSLNAEAVI